jgi:hypothetical protein
LEVDLEPIVAVVVRARCEGGKGSREVAILRESCSSSPSAMGTVRLGRRPVIRATPLEATSRPYSLGPDSSRSSPGLASNVLGSVGEKARPSSPPSADHVPLPPFLPRTVPPTGPTADTTLNEDGLVAGMSAPGPDVLLSLRHHPRMGLLAFLTSDGSLGESRSTCVRLANRGGGTGLVGGGWYESGLGWVWCWW